MPYLIAASLIFFLGALALFCFFYILKGTSAVAIQIVTGVADGTPIPMAARKKWLYTLYVPYAATGVAAGAFFTLAWMQLAGHVEDPDGRLVAHLGAFLTAFGGLSFLVNGTASTLFYRSMLRQADAD
jgi:hypothetical protein